MNDDRPASETSDDEDESSPKQNPSGRTPKDEDDSATEGNVSDAEFDAAARKATAASNDGGDIGDGAD